jgi:peptidoglycan-associated lipoprotein
MRALMLVALIPLLTACSTAMPSRSLGESDAADISGRWTGSWAGTGLFNSPRADNLTVDLAQKGDIGYGHLLLDGSIAAESVPPEIRMQGMGGIRVFARVSGSNVRLTHELGGRLFTADLTVNGDWMVGNVQGSAPGVRLVLSRPPRSVEPQAAKPAEPMPVASEPVEPPTEVVAAIIPPEEPAEAPQAEDIAPRPQQEEFASVPELKVVYFDYDKAALGPEAVDVLTNSVSWLKENAETLVLIEGNCDERGTAEYNVALGDRRAAVVADYLAASGVSRDRVTMISYGKERPLCTLGTPECMHQNRRAEFRVKSR